MLKNMAFILTRQEKPVASRLGHFGPTNVFSPNLPRQKDAHKPVLREILYKLLMVGQITHVLSFSIGSC